MAQRGALSQIKGGCMIESLKLYAQFLKEFPQEPLEISLEVKFYLRDDETPFMLFPGSIEDVE